MSGLFKSKRQEPEYKTISDPFKDLRTGTSSWIQGQIGKQAAPYEGEMVSESTPQEKKSLSYLDKYAEGGDSDLTKAGQAEISKTLKGEYDPTSSPYYQSVKAEAARNLADTQENIASKAAGGGRYWTGARLGEQGEAATDVASSLNRMLGEMSERERDRRLGAAETAESMGRREEAVPFQKASALQELGGLERGIDDTRKQAIYNEWLRQQEYPIQMAQLAQPYATQQPTMAQVGYAPSFFDKMMDKINFSMAFSGKGDSKTPAKTATTGGQ